ncbi:MAG: hypothetical protein V1850_04435 [Candidatus Bathyarchaeota archaeon]
MEEDLENLRALVMKLKGADATVDQALACTTILKQLETLKIDEARHETFLNDLFIHVQEAETTSIFQDCLRQSSPISLSTLIS